MDAPATSIKPAPNALAAVQVVASAQGPTSISASSAVTARNVEEVSIGVYATVAFLSKSSGVARGGQVGASALGAKGWGAKMRVKIIN